jgi:hypothetical protein
MMGDERPGDGIADQFLARLIQRAECRHFGRMAWCAAGQDGRAWSRSCCGCPKWCVKLLIARWTSTPSSWTTAGGRLVDARIVVENGAAVSACNYNHLAILPYPSPAPNRCGHCVAASTQCMSHLAEDAHAARFCAQSSRESRFAYLSSMQGLPVAFHTD